MTALLLQTLLLLAVAYFAGAMIGCLLRRGLSAGRRADPVPVHAGERRVDPLPEYAAGRAAKFERALSGQGAAPAAPAVPPAPSAPVAAPAAAPAPAAQAPVVAGDDLKRIRGIDAALEAKLAGLGVTRYQQIASWLKPEVVRINDALGSKGRIERENWIEQAAILSRGGDTAFSRRLARGEAAVARPTPDEGEPKPVSPGRSSGPQPAAAATALAAAAAARAVAEGQGEPPKVADRAAFSGKAGGADLKPAVPVRPESTGPDDLKRIHGITGEIETLLQQAGVTRYGQIAAWSSGDIAKVEAAMRSEGRVARENWIEQAQILSRGGDTAYSRDYDRRKASGAAPAAAPARPAKLADAIRSNTDGAAPAAPASAPARPTPTQRPEVAGFRSVKSEALRGAEPARAPSGVPDDLKRIRGVGVLIEKKLNSMGVSTYEQIANWSPEDIAHVSEQLDFKGRIERENWVEQARILSAGGQTEFSRRVDRGEVLTSKYRP